MAFRKAVRTLLLGAAQSTQADESAPASLLVCLPKEILVYIIALAAAPCTCWLPARLSQTEEDQRFMERRERRNRIVVTDEDEDEEDEEMSEL